MCTYISPKPPHCRVKLTLHDKNDCDLEIINNEPRLTLHYEIPRQKVAI